LTTPAGIIAGGDAVDQEHDFPVKGTAYSLLYTTETPQEAGDYIQKLVDGGGSMAMPFERAPWGDGFGQVFDRFGVMWAFSCEDAGQSPSAYRVAGLWPKAGIFDFSRSVAPGEVHALIGLNGAGKTTLMRAMLGMLHLTSGSVHIGGVPLNNMAQKAWKDVGHLIERPFAYPELDVRTNLKLAAQLNLVEPACIPKTVDAAIAELGLSTYAEVPARKLSLGNKQRLGLAAALQHHPKLIIL